ncbi:MAG: (d)CMP kinase [Eubacterium sp.]
MKNIVVAIDGPCCSGKSTIAENLAKDLGFKYIDTGVLYRAIAYLCFKENKRIEDNDFAQYVIDVCKLVDFDGKNVLINGEIISKSEIKNEKHAMITAQYATSRVLRDCLTEIVRNLADGESVVVDGRDCCSNIFPSADYKYYFEISTDTRIKRWIKDSSRHIEQYEIEEGIKNIDKRDKIDMCREYFPLKIEADMIVLNLDELSIEEATQKIKKAVLVGESAVYMKKTSKQVRQGKTKLKRINVLSGLIHKNTIKIENPGDNTLIIGKGIMRESFITIYGKNNHVEIKDGFDIVNLKLLVRGNNNKIIIGEDFVVNYNTNAGPVCISAKDDNNTIIIGEYAHIRGETEMVCMEGTKLIIGANLGMSSETIIRTGDGHRIFDRDSGIRTNPAEDIIIGNDCWIARRGIVLKGVVLKDYTIVGTGALVTQKYDESNIILGGNPARIIKRNISWLPGRR